MKSFCIGLPGAMSCQSLEAPTPDRGSRRRDPVGLGSILMRY
jgi:hypothetical protein